MVYDYTSNTPRTFIEEDGHFVDARVADALNRGCAVFSTPDENGHAVPIFDRQ